MKSPWLSWLHRHCYGEINYVACPSKKPPHDDNELEVTLKFSGTLKSTPAIVYR